MLQVSSVYSCLTVGPSNRDPLTRLKFCSYSRGLYSDFLAKILSTLLLCDRQFCFPHASQLCLANSCKFMLPTTPHFTAWVHTMGVNVRMNYNYVNETAFYEVPPSHCQEKQRNLLKWPLLGTSLLLEYKSSVTSYYVSSQPKRTTVTVIITGYLEREECHIPVQFYWE